MGRAYSDPEATQAVGSNAFYVTRVVDPDDEFARTEWLSWSGDEFGPEEGHGLTFADVLGVRTLELTRREALLVVRTIRMCRERVNPVWQSY